VPPRPYNLGRRQEQVSQGRRQILDATRTLLREATHYPAFSVDAVAKRADVARATVYYQFGSKTGLLEALCDDLAEAGQMSELGQVFADPDPAEALRGFIVCFGRFWDADRVVMRRLRALATLDADVAAVIDARDQRRRDGLEVLIDRMTGDGTHRAASDLDSAVRVLHALTSFEIFDQLAASHQPLADVAPLIVDLARLSLREPGPGGSGTTEPRRSGRRG
jgi:AcrR family transcriptional regulator